jgi:hypothetical protein
MFLHNCFRALTRTEDEGLHAVSGSVVGRLRTLDRMVPLRLSRQSIAGASADDRSLAETRRVGAEIAVAPVRSLGVVLKGAALRMPPTLMALLERTKVSLAAANNRPSHGVDVTQLAVGLEDAQ